MMASRSKLENAVTGQSEYVLIPRVPTKEMIDAAYWAALDEDAGAVWEAMIGSYESKAGQARETPAREEEHHLSCETPETDSSQSKLSS